MTTPTPDEHEHDVPPIDSWGSPDDVPANVHPDALAPWDFETTVTCESCKKPATRSIAYRHGKEPEYCVVPKGELLCDDHAQVVRRAAKHRADEERRCTWCKELPADYFEVIVRDELI